MYEDSALDSVWLIVPVDGSNGQARIGRNYAVRGERSLVILGALDRAKDRIEVPLDFPPVGADWCVK